MITGAVIRFSVPACAHKFIIK